jgi:hypothetical protein
MSAVVMVVSGQTGLLQILRGGDLSAICRILELRRKGIQLPGFRGIATAGSRLRSLREIVGNRAYKLIELCGTLHLKLLQLAQEAGSG